VIGADFQASVLDLQRLHHNRAQERVRPGYMPQRRVRRPTLAEEEQGRTIGLDGPDLRIEPADLNLTGSVGDRDDAVAGAEIHADCNRNHSKTALVTTHPKELYRCAPSHDEADLTHALCDGHG
jgi:hypothetical protein